MDSLRLILLLIGVGIVVGIYLWARYRSWILKQFTPGRKSAAPRPVARDEMDEPDEAAIQQELERMQQVMNGQDPEAVNDKELLLIVSVVAPPDQPFNGEALGKAFSGNNLKLGEKGIFHRFTRCEGVDKPIFGIANMVKPGDFGDGRLEGFTTPGITFFLQLPTAIDGLEAFDDFVHTIERLAVELGGQLQDQKHCVITHQALMQIRENIASSRLHTQVAS